MRNPLYFLAISMFVSLSDLAAASTLAYCKEGWDVETADDLSVDSAAIAFAESRAPKTTRNQVLASACWTQEHLRLAIRVHDADLIAAPKNLSSEQFHTYDSLQIYLDPFADSTISMNRDDIDVLLLPDGRYAVLRGDELLREIDQALVPQRESAPLQVEYRTKIRADGWSALVAIPFAGLGITPAKRGRLRWDLAMNDWRVDVATVTNPREASSTHLQIAAGVPDEQAFAPLALSGARDFGFPRDWLTLDLVGTPPWHESLLQHLGGRGFIGAFGGLLVALSGGIFFSMQWRHRRHLRALLDRIGVASQSEVASRRAATELEQTPAHEVERSQNAAMPARDSVDSAARIDPEIRSDSLQTPSEQIVTPSTNALDECGPCAPASAPPLVQEGSSRPEFDPRDRVFAQQVLGYIRADLSHTHTPASLAAHFHVSLRTFQRRIKSGLGANPQDLILAARLEHAHELLQRGELRVSEVASRVGFEDFSHFSRRFREAYGHPPSQVRSQPVQ